METTCLLAYQKYLESNEILETECIRFFEQEEQTRINVYSKITLYYDICIIKQFPFFFFSLKFLNPSELIEDNFLYPYSRDN